VKSERRTAVDKLIALLGLVLAVIRAPTLYGRELPDGGFEVHIQSAADYLSALLNRPVTIRYPING
jgi:hypothetical protein